MLEKYIQMFGTLRTDRGGDRYPEITYHRAPHKPFLLLSVMDFIAQGRITHNFIEPFHKVLCRWARPEDYTSEPLHHAPDSKSHSFREDSHLPGAFEHP
jgi:hypothetical protein